ncbi:hypothetical protein PG993_009119 [Apiospora rasikravindrae]|uniref:AAA+ ATPase domain-containing protein n=1 Tax=Apiospora rasikravindrae TaxID=990691 RepID=A0ABR1SIG3_9PEZI
MAEDATNGSGPVSQTPLSEEALANLQQGLAAEDQPGSTNVVSERYLKLHEAHNKLHELHNDTNERLNQFERRLKKVESSRSRSRSSRASTVSDRSDLEDDYRLGYEENTIPEVRDSNFELFKNRFGDEDGKNCVEALIAGSNLDEQIRQELGRRDPDSENDHKRRLNYDDNEETIIHRVRIQSPAILWLLSKTLEETNSRYEWKGQNRTTFYRPFAWFIYVQEKMKDELRKLEDHWSSTPFHEDMQKETVEETIVRLQQSVADETAQEPVTVNRKPELTSDTKDEAQGIKHKSLARRTERTLLERALGENYHTLLELRCYTEFVEKRILPPTRRYQDPDKPEAQTIRYQDLWFLFPPGELVVASNSPVPSIGGAFTKTETQIGRCLRREKPDATRAYGWTQPYVNCQTTRKPDPAFDTFDVFVSAIDYNGEEFGPVTRYITIDSFDGLREVTTLPVYPLRFHKERDELRKSFGENGSKFKKAIDSRHMAYLGWSCLWAADRGSRRVGAPDDDTPRPQQVDSTDTIMRNSTYIESDVIVDVKEAIRVSSDTSIDIVGARYTPIPDLRVFQETTEIIRWSDKKRTEKLSVVQDRTQTGDAVCYLEATRFAETHPFAKSQKDPTFTSDDLLLLPDRIYAYALRERKFFKADVRYLRPLQPDTDAFKSLKIDPEHIRIVQATVASHFQHKEMEVHKHDGPRPHPWKRPWPCHSAARGSGGVGKTATAEAVALKFQRPLFVITCGDLGFTPQGVESSLSEIFRLAHLWNCILLLDEADVFLSQRENNSLKRNALVSVFLRVLEYYNGILFLTTNRVGTLDEAFKSRVHLSLYYPALDKAQTQDIIRMNLDRLRTIEEQRAKITGRMPLFIEEKDICNFSAQHFEKHRGNDGAGRWNGRQIRNAVQIAASLAWYDRKTSTEPGADKAQPVLDSRHFRTVEATMTLFEGYMAKTKGGDGAFIAEQRGERYDRFSSPAANNRQGTQPQAVVPGPSNPPGAQGGLHSSRDGHSNNCQPQRDQAMFMQQALFTQDRQVSRT